MAGHFVAVQAKRADDGGSLPLTPRNLVLHHTVFYTSNTPVRTYGTLILPQAAQAGFLNSGAHFSFRSVPCLSIKEPPKEISDAHLYSVPPSRPVLITAASQISSIGSDSNQALPQKTHFL